MGKPQVGENFQMVKVWKSNGTKTLKRKYPENKLSIGKFTVFSPPSAICIFLFLFENTIQRKVHFPMFGEKMWKSVIYVQVCAVFWENTS